MLMPGEGNMILRLWMMCVMLLLLLRMMGMMILMLLKLGQLHLKSGMTLTTVHQHMRSLVRLIVHAEGGG